MHLAQSAFIDCRNSIECCIKKFPTTAAQSCGATADEITKVLTGAEILNEAAESATLKGADVPEREDGGEGEGEGEGTPEWKKKCMALYTECQQERWRGNCGDCFRYCEGQRGKWPFKKCRER